MVDHPDAKPGCFTLKPRYSAAELAREMNVDDQAMLRLLAEEGVVPRRGRHGRRKWIWLSDLRNCCPHLLDSWAEVRHQRELAKGRAA